MAEILFKEESYSIIGASMKVHAELGSGFLEAVYQEALERELTKRRIPFERQKKLSIIFDGQTLNKYYIADFICYNQIILELKVVNDFSKAQFLQLRNYLKATKLKLGILINFGKTSLEYKRIINPSC
ncbi:MAG: GxxExxY protein [Prolixibacteraceae bacterium]|jgi:GxxExxY protein|nr:GxxExxY protein [Prolixibacteraceae bacterium]